MMELRKRLRIRRGGRGVVDGWGPLWSPGWGVLTGTQQQSTASQGRTGGGAWQWGRIVGVKLRP